MCGSIVKYLIVQIGCKVYKNGKDLDQLKVILDFKIFKFIILIFYEYIILNNNDIERKKKGCYYFLNLCLVKYDVFMVEIFR